MKHNDNSLSFLSRSLRRDLPAADFLGSGRHRVRVKRVRRQDGRHPTARILFTSENGIHSEGLHCFEWRDDQGESHFPAAWSINAMEPLFEQSEWAEIEEALGSADPSDMGFVADILVDLCSCLVGREAVIELRDKSGYTSLDSAEPVGMGANPATTYRRVLV